MFEVYGSTLVKFHSDYFAAEFSEQLTSLYAYSTVPKFTQLWSLLKEIKRNSTNSCPFKFGRTNYF